VRLVGVLGNLDDRTCKFQEKLNPVTTCRITIFEACSVKNLCLHLRCSEGRALFLFLSLAYLCSLDIPKKMERKTKREEDRYFYSLS